MITKLNNNNNKQTETVQPAKGINVMENINNSQIESDELELSDAELERVIGGAKRLFQYKLRLSAADTYVDEFITLDYLM